MTSENFLQEKNEACDLKALLESMSKSEQHQAFLILQGMKMGKSMAGTTDAAAQSEQSAS